MGAVMLHLAAPDFTLSWTHSVEKTEWRETWDVTDAGLRLTGAAVKGSGAGMDPAPDAVLQDGWWVWHPVNRVVPELVLAASGATGGGWTLCADGTCYVLGQDSGAAVRVGPCLP